MYTAKTLTGERSAIFQKEAQVSQNENWNLLYVAMTRAKQGLWISGVASNSKTGIKERSWYGRALAAGVTILDVDALNLPDMAAQASNTQEEFGSMPFQMDHFAIEWAHAQKDYQDLVSQIESGEFAKELAEKSIQQAQVQPDPEILEEGTNFHKLLEFLTPDSSGPIKPPMPTEQEVMNWLRVDQDHAKRVIERVTHVLTATELKPYLTSGKWIAAWNELDIASTEGKSYRMDRLVEFDDHIAILDYKLTIPEMGSEKYEQYREQLQNYRNELTRIRKDKPNKAYLISSCGEIMGPI
jgi:ATP-dependent helicase/nuclease subunit A